jgi:tRNA pseudouridine32 synthase/23S rRNA pseudouridine746 synthase
MSSRQNLSDSHACEQESLEPYHVIPPCHEPVVEIYRDDVLLIVEKPAFLLSVPGRGPEKRDSVLTRLEDENDEVYLLHRLDLDTSGLMVFARTRLAQKRIARAFQKRAVKKRYEAIVAGLMDSESGRIDLPIAPDWKSRPRNKISHETGKPALTHWQVLSENRQQKTSHLALMPETGRTHQLRLHLQAIGHPILGCDLYAPPDVEALSPRLLLHACELAFHHPITDEWVTFHSSAPFQNVGEPGYLQVSR